MGNGDNSSSKLKNPPVNKKISERISIVVRFLSVSAILYGNSLDNCIFDCL